MSRGPHRFKQSDVTRAARAVAAAPRVGELITRRLIRVIPSGIIAANISRIDFPLVAARPHSQVV
jgi:hypothetical protein